MKKKRILVTLLLIGAGFVGIPFAGDVKTCLNLNVAEPFDRLKPVTVTDVRGEKRILEGETPLAIEDIPPFFLVALIASEDRRFLVRNSAIDLRSITRAAVQSALGHKQGASTLWMQAVRAAYPLPSGSFTRSFKRKIFEVIVAKRLFKNTNKSDLLVLYCSYANFGGQIGLRAAARKFFSKEPKSLTPNECYFLIGTLPSPKKYGKPARAREVVQKMVNKLKSENLIDDEMHLKPGLPVVFRIGKPKPAAELPRGIRSEILRAVGPKWLERARHIGGANVVVNIDFALQEKIQATLSSAVKTLAPQIIPDQPGNLEGAVVVLDVKTGGVLACVGSRDAQREFSCATQADRQAGSTIKGPILGCAFDGKQISKELLVDAPVDPSQVPGIDSTKPWPANPDGRYLGQLSAQQAFALSRNPVFVKLGECNRSTLDSFLRATHLGAVQPKNPAQFIGTNNCQTIYLAGAYLPFASGGEYRDPHIIHALETKNEIFAIADVKTTQLVSKEAADAVFSAMLAATRYGTARDLADLGGGSKTGTSSSDNDGHPADLRLIYAEHGDFVLALWIGPDKGKLKRGASSHAVLATARSLIEIVKKYSTNNNNRNAALVANTQ